MKKLFTWMPTYVSQYVSADIMASLCSVCVGIHVNNFFSKSTRPRDMLFFLKDTLCIEDEKVFKACRSVGSMYSRAITNEVPPPEAKISTLYHNFLFDYCRDVSLILHI